MAIRQRKVGELRNLLQAEAPDVDASGLQKDQLAKIIAEARIAVCRVSETNLIASQQVEAQSEIESLSHKVALEIKRMNKDSSSPNGGAAAEKDLLNGFHSLQRCVANVCASSGYTASLQTEVLAVCSSLTTHINTKADIGGDMLRIKSANSKGFKGLSALAPRDAAAPLELFLRGTISPSMAVPSSAVVVMPVGEMTVDCKTVDLSLFMTKDQSLATPWCGSRFCPAMLVDQPKDKSAKPAKAGKGKGKGNKRSDASTEDLPTVTLTLTSEDEDITVPQHSVPITLKIYSLRGEVPPPPPAPVADVFTEPAEDAGDLDMPKIVRLQCPSIKRARDESSDATASKRRRATTLLLGSAGDAGVQNTAAP